MHIPDGYLSPATVVLTYAVAVPLWITGFKRLRRELNEETLPLIGALAALSFIIMMFNIPIPGGTSGHAVGAALIAILFSPWVAFVAVSLVLLIQALLFGDGGISTFAANALSMAFVGSFVGYYVFTWLKNRSYAPFAAGWSALVASSVLTAFLLGIQPIFWHQGAQPLYFPFSLRVTFPALVLPHMLFFGVAEGIFTALVYRYLHQKELGEKAA
ncbi:cobalt transporter CbiM [Nitratifractor salsuginis]|uniref:Cobalamin (Vitamin B12) biosynthesis CbiM protein n=1 Tax=Nitratifractor salsuginis (strain DSM 16511 / JCM 12458 / E9I37-1) TaxID=749222 RepID=E6WYA6_NITSE|nr:cobalt transporter CbiM [Nitratifractor salsuginis]ADV45354.1 cobalamin (vitamin B12) biosynthesis CbiM protein [Nitratifractor salsuginis DSM 16511]